MNVLENKNMQDHSSEEQPHVEPRFDAVEEPKNAVAESSSVTPEEFRKGLIEKLKTLLDQNVADIKDEVENIKNLFYKSLNSEKEVLMARYVEAGNEEEFFPKKDESEAVMKALIAQYKTKRAAVMAQMEQDRENNLLQKLHILEQMRALTEQEDDVSAHIKEFKDLQQKWSNIGQVPQKESSNLWTQYNLLREKFWDLVKINYELREYDFKKNLEVKLQLCETLEKLLDEPDVIAAFRQFQQLREEWWKVGPVEKALREEIWGRFKAASNSMHKKHQDFCEEIHKSEEKNMEAKVALCELLEGIDYESLHSFKAWEEAQKQVLAWQAEWLAVGLVPRKSNSKLNKRYRVACDLFFKNKNLFFKTIKAEQAENLQRKRELCERAEAVQESSDWKETADLLIQLQKEWKAIGFTPRKQADELWTRFRAACDHFFLRRDAVMSDQKEGELENLAKKQELIEQINAFEAKENTEQSLASLRELAARWNAIGFVPFKEKDKLYKKYRKALDAQFDKLNLDAAARRMDAFRSDLDELANKGEDDLYRERNKLMRSYEHLKAEIITYENNLGFFTSSSKKGGGLIKEMERKIQSSREKADLLAEKIRLLDEKLAE